MLENSGLLKIQFVSQARWIFELIYENGTKSYVPNVLLNVKLVLKVLNVLHVTQQLTELKVTTH